VPIMTTYALAQAGIALGMIHPKLNQSNWFIFANHAFVSKK
jgi:hypothetical protein